MNKMILAVLLVGLVAFGAWSMRSGQNTGPAMEAQISPTPSTSNSSTTDPNTDVVEISVDGDEFSFAPNTLKLKKGQKVRLTLKNIGEMPHDFVIDELDVKTKIISGGNEDVVEFTPDKAGTFEYYCSVGKHREQGMVGTLTVEE